MSSLIKIDICNTVVKAAILCLWPKEKIPHKKQQQKNSKTKNRKETFLFVVKGTFPTKTVCFSLVFFCRSQKNFWRYIQFS